MVDMDGFGGGDDVKGLDLRQLAPGDIPKGSILYVLV